MKFHVLTLFPEMIMQGLGTSIMGRAVETGVISLDAVNIRDFSTDKHKKVDDYTYGGGAGMLMQAQPVFDAWNATCNGRKVRTVYLTPQGIPFTQRIAEDLAKEEEVVFLCGHYEGIDERVLEEIVTDYVSIGDYVLTGGELPAMVMIDAISRLVPGVLNNESSAETESFQGNLLEYPQYSRPEVWHDKKVPEVLLSGDHKKINAWRLEQSISRTKERRPDLYQSYEKQQACIAFLMKDKLSHIEMIELLNRGNAVIRYFNKDGVLLEDTNSKIFMATATSEMGASRIIEILKIHNKQQTLIVAHQEFLKDMLCETFGYVAYTNCKQAVYTRKEVLSIKKHITEKFEFRQFDVGYISVFHEFYPSYGIDYITDRLNQNAVWGLFEENKLIGFIGIHGEGSMGMLQILPQYQRKGMGSILESYMINHMLKLGYIPYCQIDIQNEPSMRLQEKLGLYLSKNTVWWLRKE